MMLLCLTATNHFPCAAPLGINIKKSSNHAGIFMKRMAFEAHRNKIKTLKEKRESSTVENEYPFSIATLLAFLSDSFYLCFLGLLCVYCLGFVLI
jgi:hypothetical protein